MSSYTEEEQEAIVELRSFMLNEVTEPAMRLIKTIFERSCPFTYNIEYAVNHNTFLVITNPDNTTMDPLLDSMIWDFEASCEGDVLAFPVNCFEDDENAFPIQEKADAFGHANLIIANRILRTLEHFDPHGYKMNDLTASQQSRFESAVQKLFLKGPWRDYTYLPPRKVCPTNGIQNLLIDHGEEERIKSTCRIWCYHFLYERLTQPEKSALEINKSNLMKIRKGFGPIGEKVDKFIMDFIFTLYKAINVSFEHKENALCLKWPQSPSNLYCTKKTKSRTRGSSRRGR